jgi:endonuclease YncB( thermonuclease family)
VLLLPVALTAAVKAVERVASAPPVYRVDHVVDGDTIALRNGLRVRLVQIGRA